MISIANNLFSHWLLATAGLLVITGCNRAPLVNQSPASGYQFSRPGQVFVLPDTLREVSGIACLDSVTMACVQDENGILFLFDLRKGKISGARYFAGDGDYEGITRAESSLFILRSDGILFELSGNGDSLKTTLYETGMPAGNHEGLCYDANNDRLLIASKGKPGKGRENKDLRLIYGFDLKTKSLLGEPVYRFNLEEIKVFAANHSIGLPTRGKKKGREPSPLLRFRPSAIGIHPLSGKLYLLSAADHMLFIFDEAGRPKHIELLDPLIFNKAEGICFLDNGDAVITNEGQEGKPTLLRFTYMP